MKRRTTTIIICILAIFVSLMIFMLSPKGLGAVRILHLVFMPSNLFEPIISDDFKFYKDNFSSEYMLKPKYRDFYEILISSKTGFKASDFSNSNDRYDLKGEFRIELFSGDEKIIDETVNRWSSATFMGNDLKTYTDLSIFEFPVQINGLKIEDTKLKISVVEPSQLLGKYKNDLQLQVRVSARK